MDVARLSGTGVVLERVQTIDMWPFGQARLVRADWVSFGGDIPGSVIHARYRGPHTDYAVNVARGTLLVREAGRTSRSPGDIVSLSIHRTWDFGPDEPL